MESKSDQIDMDIEMKDNSVTELLNVNAFCLLAIMAKMPYKDLISMSFLSKDFKLLAHDVAYRKWTNTSLTIVSSPVNEGYELKFDDKFHGNYLKYISESIRNVQVSTKNVPVERVIEFILKNCCPNLLSLGLDVEQRFNGNHGEMLKSILKGLTSLNFTDAHLDTDVYNNILKHCTNLKKFTYNDRTESSESSELINSGKMEWILNENLKLQELNIDLTNFHLANEFENISQQFMRQNRQLRSFDYNAKKRHVTVKLNNGEVECVSLRYRLLNINSIYEDLNKFTLNGNPGGLKLYSARCSNENMREIVHLNRKYPIIEWVTNLNNFSTFTYIQSLKNLTVLELTFCEQRNVVHPLKPFLETLSTALPKVERIFFNFHPKSLTDKHRFADITMPFIANMAKLKVFVVRFRDDTFFEYGRNDVKVLNVARNALKNACPMLLSLGFYFRRIKPEFDVPDKSMIKMEVQRGFA